MAHRLKVGVVGGGVGINHIKAYQALPDLYSIEAICDIDAARAATVARENGIPRAITDLRDLLALDVDIVDIATPSNLHASQASAALDAGHHVIVEKPAAGSLAEIDMLARSEKRSGKRLSPVFQYRFSNGLQRFLRVKAAGLLGKAYVATIETHWRRPASYYANPWRGRWASELGGCLITHAIHAHDILTEVLGPIASVYAITDTRVNAIETEDCAAATLRMENGALVTLSVTLGSDKEISRLRFCFDGLTVESNLDPYNPGTEPWQLTVPDPGLQQKIDDATAGFAPGPERWEGQFLRIHRALTEGGELPVTLADARRSIELITAAYHSARTGRAVALPIGKRHPLYGGWLPAAPESG